MQKVVNDQTCKVLELDLGTISFAAGDNVYGNCFNTRSVLCWKPKERRETKNKKITTCFCHLVPDAVPIAFPMDMVAKDDRERLLHQGLYFTLPPTLTNTLHTEHPFKKFDRYTMNPVFALFALRNILERLGMRQDETFEYIKYGPSLQACMTHRCRVHKQRLLLRSVKRS